ncbi:CinA family nicotinamide mononucleotide deamidase-related protein [Limisalsivibrio acetivorans]|uniref:CinA family nicotinamide mononucleotide deamidase-related protein n=1 Tax=Limisalsivibrio acetivorans TaxID=1304888 RepID=UPI0003B6FD4F|nr:CinA family nicotinamide mononucleotide deamidase-related protein [Limisalsivibrio acetivorans]
MVKTAIFAVGSELLEGSIVDTNSAWLGSNMVRFGAPSADVRLIPDNPEILHDALLEASSKYQIILTTGGLGPTFDDLTAEIVAKVAGRDYVTNETQKKHMIDRLAERGVKPKEGHFRQAMLPAGCTLFPNDNGTALGFAVELNGAVIVSMPGIPYEMKPMFLDHVIPWLKTRFDLQEIAMLDMRLAGLPESDADDIIRDLGIPEGVECILNVSRGELLIKLRGYDEDVLKSFANEIRRRLPDKFVGYGDEDLPTMLVRILKEKGMKVSFAESCTGGMLGQDLTNIAGSSEVFEGSLVTYSNNAKMSMLGVREDTLIEHGAVSAETAAEMAEGAAKALNTECSAGVTGIAGPGGGTDEKPVGTVYISIKVKDRIITTHNLFPGDRESVRIRTAKTVFREMTKMIRES